MEGLFSCFLEKNKQNHAFQFQKSPKLNTNKEESCGSDT